MKRHIALISTEKNHAHIAQLLANSLEMMLFDCEQYICFNNSMTISQIIEKANVTYFKKQVSKAIAELDDLQNMVFVSCNQHLLSVSDLQKLNDYCYVIYLFDSENAFQYDKNSCVPSLEFFRLCARAHTRYRSRCDFALDMHNLDEKETTNKICEFLQSLV